MAKRRQDKSKLDKASKNYFEAVKLINQHPIFSPLMNSIGLYRSADLQYPQNGYAYVNRTGSIYCHPKILLEPEEWMYVIAHGLLHFGFWHFEEHENPYIWNLSCDIVIARFLDDLKLGKPPRGAPYLIKDLPANNEEKLYKYFLENGIDKNYMDFGTGNPGECDLNLKEPHNRSRITPEKMRKIFSIGLSNAVMSAVNVAAGKEKVLGAEKYEFSNAQMALSWIINSYPLLGSLAVSFDIIENPILCYKMEISVAAINPETKEIYINPAAGLNLEESKFVIAHELLHAGLRHDVRTLGRNHYYWNVACDYVINSWLKEMEIGDPPDIGMLFDPELRGESAESVYELITTDLRKLRKLATFRGIGKSDIINPNNPNWWNTGDSISLDAFYKRCLMQGLEYHYSQDRGYLPAGLIEEIKSLAFPPIPWDVELANWFDEHFDPLEKIRSYARPSRRQASTPDIPRPRYIDSYDDVNNRTFAVILDTSGSMDRSLLAKALGAITSYSISRDVRFLRLLFCDAETYDQGFVTPEELSARVKIKGRGGTVLQPAIQLIEKAEDFPKTGPILIITDGYCDKLAIKREHAFLIPSYATLPFVPKGKVFRI